MIFWKFQANGNDFVLLLKKEHNYDIKKMCDRNIGIGADGVLEVQVMEEGVSYVHYNADGSAADLCVNGLRCVGAWYAMIEQQNAVWISIANTRYYVEVLPDHEIQATLPLPTVHEHDLYVLGVPHQIVPVLPASYDEFANYDAIEFIGPNEIVVVTMERGVGITKACGSGMACSYYHGYRIGQLKASGKASSAGGSARIAIFGDRLTIASEVSCVFAGIYFE